MGIPSRKLADARPGVKPDRATGRTQAAQNRARGKGLAAGLILALLAGFAAAAEPLRIATWHVEFTRRGPGLLLRDILKGDDPGVMAAARVLARVAPDVVLLTGFDWDYDLRALDAFADVLAAQGLRYDQRFSLQPNSAEMTGLDMDGDGRLGGPGDAQGWGRYSGYGGMALLSKLPIDRTQVVDFSTMLWADLPGALLPEVGGKPYPSAEALRIQRLSSVGHWRVPLRLEDGTQIDLLAFSATPPVFDGPEDRNGRRNHDEIDFWAKYLDRQVGKVQPDVPVVVLGNANLDPADGEGLKAAITNLLSHPRLQDPLPQSAGGVEAAASQGGVNARQRGDPALDTADWSDEGGPGNLRVSYVLPDKALRVVGSGVFWPAPDSGDQGLIEGGSRHRLVWVDLDF